MMKVKELLQEAANEIGYDAEIAAFPVSETARYGSQADIILLGPQVRFNLKKVQEQFPKKPVHAIDMRDYGTMNGKGVISTVKKILGDE
ncbi:MAG: PTS sugar transporter subunit IIB [Erysipelotrichaceae bacterium]|nr:PTS sugar transporter subunit IIB [Erysipelotrichaceae bacterium]